MDDKRKISSRSDIEELDRKQKTGAIGDLLIEFGHGISAEDTLLSRKDKNAVDFVLNYSKIWCKCLKDIVYNLEKRALYENECMRATSKLFQGLETSLSTTAGAPLCEETIQLSHMIVDQAKETELHNTKRCRELLEVMNRQRTEFAKTRKFLKAKWKADVKKMVDAESVLFKAKASYFSRCQTGVKLREELATAQSLLNDMQGNLVASALTIPTPQTSTAATPSNGSPQTLSPSLLSSTESGIDLPDPALMNQVVKQKSRVERLEKQLADNDKKEIEQMYTYKESVEAANIKLCDLEKSKVEIICDTRLTIMKCDEVVSDSMAELISHLFVTRSKMLAKYEVLATNFQNYQPCKPYQLLLQSHVDKAADVITEKYQFEGFHEASLGGVNKERSADAPFGKFVSRFAQFYSKDSNEAADVYGVRGHSDSDSDADEGTPVRGNGGSAVGSGGTVLSSLVEFGSNLFRPDLKKSSIRSKQRATVAGSAASAALMAEEQAAAAAQEAAMEKELDIACYVITQCVDGIEKHLHGTSTMGIYRIPASKVKVAAVLESLRIAQEAAFSSVDLSEEHPITLASAIKTKLISLPEPLLSYNFYSQFVDIGRALDSVEEANMTEQVAKLSSLLNQLSPAIRRVAGLLFHHLKRISNCQAVNQMGAANLATMFGPTVLRQRPKFQVANMMEFVDNKWLMKVVEVAIERATEIFGPPANFTSHALLKFIRGAVSRQEEGQQQKEAQTYCTSSAISRERFFSDLLSEAPNIAAANPSTTVSVNVSKPLPLYKPYFDRPSSVSNVTARPPSLAQIPHKIGSTDELRTVTSFGGRRNDSVEELEKKPSGKASPRISSPRGKSRSPGVDVGSRGESSSGVSGLKRLVSAKAISLQQHFQQRMAHSTTAGSISEGTTANATDDSRNCASFGVGGLVSGLKGLVSSPKSISVSRESSSVDAGKKTTPLTTDNYSYIDNDNDAD